MRYCPGREGDAARQGRLEHDRHHVVGHRHDAADHDLLVERRLDGQHVGAQRARQVGHQPERRRDRVRVGPGQGVDGHRATSSRMRATYQETKASTWRSATEYGPGS